MENEKDFQNLKDELKSLQGKLNFVHSELQEKIDGLKNEVRARVSEDARRAPWWMDPVWVDAHWKKDFQVKVLNVHAGAVDLVPDVRHEIWCTGCGKLLGCGDTERAAWEAAGAEPQFTCAATNNPECESKNLTDAVKTTLVDSDFVVELSEVDTKRGSRLELREFPEIAADERGFSFPRTVVVSSDKHGHMIGSAAHKLHVTITEVPE